MILACLLSPFILLSQNTIEKIDGGANEIQKNDKGEICFFRNIDKNKVPKDNNEFFRTTLKKSEKVELNLLIKGNKRPEVFTKNIVSTTKAYLLNRVYLFCTR